MDERPGRPSWFRDRRPTRWGLGDAIRLRREEIGLSRREVAERAGLSYPYLSELETGKKRGSPDSIRSVAEALGLGQDELWARADQLATAEPIEVDERLAPDAPNAASARLATGSSIAEPAQLAPEAPTAEPAAARRSLEPEPEPDPEVGPRDLATRIADALQGATVERAEAALLMALGELRYRMAGRKRRPEDG